MGGPPAEPRRTILEPSPGEDPGEVLVEPGEAAGGDDAVAGVISRGSVYSLVTVVQAASVMLAIPVLTRLLDPDEYGLLTATLVAQAVLTHLCGFGMPAAVTRTYFRRGPDGARALIFVAAAAALGVGVVALALGPLWAGIFDSVDFGPELGFAVASAVASAVMVSAQMGLRAAGRARDFVIGAALAIAGGQLSGLAAVALGHGPTGYMVGLTIGFCAGLAFAWPAAGVQPGPLRRAAGGRELVGRALQVGLPTIWMGLSLYLLSAADRVVVERIEGAAAAGNYYIAYAVGSLGVFLVAAMNGAWSPAIFAAEEEGRWRFLADSAVAITRLAAWAAAALTIAAPLALRLFAPADYDVADLGLLSALVAVSALPYLWYLSSANLAIWRAKTGRLAASSVVAVVLNLGLCAALVGPLGLEGAALATLVAYTFLGALTWLWTRSLATIPWDHSALALAAAPALAAVAVTELLPTDDLWLVIRGVIAAAIGAWVARGVLARDPQPG